MFTFLQPTLQSLLSPRLSSSGSKGDVAVLFLTRTGTPLRVDTLWKIIRSHRDAARLPQSVTTHSLRHTCATEMLKGGANVRHVQEMLGHADICTTQIYTHPSQERFESRVCQDCVKRAAQR